MLAGSLESSLLAGDLLKLDLQLTLSQGHHNNHEK